jgi:hypothetical protein
MIAAAALSFAIVAQDQSALRASPSDTSIVSATLYQGEPLEVRGQKGEYLQVYDHRIERAGYIRAWQVRPVTDKPEDAPALLAVVRFLHDAPGQESLGIAYAAAYLNAAPASAIDGEPFEAIGTFADRLARTASARQNTQTQSTPVSAAVANANATLAAHLDVATNYGVKFSSFDRDDHVQLCYDGEAFRRVMALPASDTQRANAALALTSAQCIDPAITPSARAALDQWRADVLNRVKISELAPYLKDRIHLAKAGVYSSLTFEAARAGVPDQAMAQTALAELTAVVPQDLTESDLSSYSEASIRVSTVRYRIAPIASQGGAIQVATLPGDQPGQTCVLLTDKTHNQAHPLVSRCTFGIPAINSARLNARGSAMVMAVTPTDGWQELWVFQHRDSGWTVDVLPPGVDVGLGYVEFAGFVPDLDQFLAVREVRTNGRFVRTFEVIDMATLATQLHADAPTSIKAFYRWQDATWKHQTLSLR